MSNPKSSSSAQASPARAKKISPLTIVLILLIGLGIISIINNFALPKMLLRSFMDRGDDTRTADRAVEEALGRAELRQANGVVSAIDHDQITDPASLRNSYDPIRNNTKQMLAVLRRENNFGNGAGTSPQQASCPGVQVLGGGVLKLDIPANCGNAFEVALVNSNVKKTFHVQFTSEQLTEPPFTTGRGTNMNYDPQTQTLTIEGDLYYKHKPEDIGKQALLILRPTS